MEALVSTDAVSHDHTTSGSVGDSSSDTVSDCASEISDDVASVIEVPVAASGSSGSDVIGGDVGRLESIDGDVSGCDDAESGICPDYDSIDDSLTPPLCNADITNYFRTDFQAPIPSGRDRSPTPTADTSSTAMTATMAPLSNNMVATDGQFHLVHADSRNNSNAVDSVVTSRVSVNIHDSRSDGNSATASGHRDFSQTAPWRMSGAQNRSSKSQMTSVTVGASYSDPDIVSSSAAAERAAASDFLHAGRRRRGEHDQSFKIAMRLRDDATAVGKAPLQSSTVDHQQTNVVRIPISFTSTATTLPAAPRVSSAGAVAASAAPSSSSAIDDRSTSQVATPSTSAEQKTATSKTASASVAVTSPRCYIPQKPPPLPMPGSVGPDPRSSLRSVRSTNSDESPVKTDQPLSLSSSSQPTAAASQRRRKEDDTERRNRTTDVAPFVEQYGDEQADLPSRPVREMVAELNNRLERCERSSSDADSPYGSRYDLREAEAARGRRRSSSGSDSEREIIIDTPPASVIGEGQQVGASLSHCSALAQCSVAQAM